MSETKVENIEAIKTELQQVKAERDQYRAAYEAMQEQSQNLWGLYSNTVDYIVAQTKRKQQGK